jgi:YgiT-type zinc finger domain-containing protein
MSFFEFLAQQYPNTQAACPFCGSCVTSDLEEFKEHIRKHKVALSNGQSGWKCPACGAEFEDEGTFLSHLGDEDVTSEGFITHHERKKP